MATTRFKGETAGERLDLSSISDSDMIQLRHKPGTIDDADKGISKSQLLSCPFGVSDTAAATAAKAADLTDSNPDFTLVSGREVVVCFTAANTASNPTLNFAGSGAIPLYMPNGAPVGAWNAGAWMHLKYFYATVGNSQIQRWILMSQEVDNEVIMAASATITGKTIVSGSTIKVMFTADLSGSDTTTALSLTYNGTSYNVKVGKNGTLSNFTASEVSSGVYKYLQAYTTLELAFDGTQFIIAGNPLVLSGSGYEIHADGMGKVNEVTADNMNSVTSNAVWACVSNPSINFGFPRGGSFTTPILQRQNINNNIIYAGRVVVGSDATGGSLYFNIDGIRGENGWNMIGFWRIIGTTFDSDTFGRFSLSSNASIWLQKGNADNTNYLISSEAAGKTIEFVIYAIRPQ